MQRKLLTCSVQVTMFLTPPDPEDAPKRKHQKITVNFPIRILSCHATPANIDLPAYSEPDSVDTIDNRSTLFSQSPHSDLSSASAAVQVTDHSNILVTGRHISSPPAYESLIPSGTSGR